MHGYNSSASGTHFHNQLKWFPLLKCVVQFTFPSFPSYCYPGYSLIYLNLTFLFLPQIHQSSFRDGEKHHHIKCVSHGHAHSAQLSSTFRRTCCNEHTDPEPLLAAPTGPLLGVHQSWASLTLLPASKWIWQDYSCWAISAQCRLSQ